MSSALMLSLSLLVFCQHQHISTTNDHVALWKCRAEDKLPGHPRGDGKGTGVYVEMLDVQRSIVAVLETLGAG